MRTIRNVLFALVVIVGVHSSILPTRLAAQYCTAVANKCVSQGNCDVTQLPDCGTLCSQQCNKPYVAGSSQYTCGAGGPIGGCSGTDVRLTLTCQCYAPPPPPPCGQRGNACGGPEPGCCSDLTCQDGACWPPTESPILINVANNGADHLTSAIDGVIFDINADGAPERVAWTSADSQVGFLVWDRNQNGVIDNGSELFGTATRLRHGKLAANGFEALREWDSNRDRRIDSSDPVYGSLRLWFDVNHNGYSESDELLSLQSVGILSIETDYRETSRRDRYGNWYRYEGPAVMRLDEERVLRRVFDVFLVTVR
jgi:hypothetical protein